MMNWFLSKYVLGRRKHIHLLSSYTDLAYHFLFIHLPPFLTLVVNVLDITLVLRQSREHKLIFPGQRHHLLDSLTSYILSNPWHGMDGFPCKIILALPHLTARIFLGLIPTNPSKS